MKHLCCSKIFIGMVVVANLLFGGLFSKSATLYYGSNISYPMVGGHDYIIVQPNNTNVYTHGFDVYRDKMYAYVSIGEIDTTQKSYKFVKKSWIKGDNKAWKSKVLDLTNKRYQKFIFDKLIEPQIKRGFKNFFFDTIDSYMLFAKNKKDKEASKKALVQIIKTFHKKYPKAKLILNRGFELLDQVHNYVNAILFESYFFDSSGKRVTKDEQKWLDKMIQRVKSYGLDAISVEYFPFDKLYSKEANEVIKKLLKKGVIPVVATKDLDTYPRSSKEPIKREILTLIDTSIYKKVYQGAHQYGALPLEYMGYIESLHDVKDGLPTIKKMQQYAGVIVWLSNYYKNPKKFAQWLKMVKDAGIKIAFCDNFGIKDINYLKEFGIINKDYNPPDNNQNKVVIQDKMIGFEAKPSLNYDGDYIKIKRGKILFEMKDRLNHKTTLSAITPWGGFAIGNSFMTQIGEDNIWVIDPFKFFKKALRLKDIPAMDVTTQNGKRVSFAHIYGDASMSRAEWNPKLFSIGVIYRQILSKYKLPTSVSVIGSEIDNNGLYPKLAPKLQKIVKKIYKLPNIEPATHTFSHPFFWGKIKNGDLSPKYRLKPKGYKFSLDYEIGGMLKEINSKYIPKDKKLRAKTVFWAGDCLPPKSVLEYVYKHHILNINGGDTYITNLHPWLSYVAPLGIQKGEYYQIYTGAQDENVYTNDWTGPFWGFKKVVQTYKLTDKPRRLKPIDIYYHFYSGSKRASLNALKYVYNWVQKQDIFPLFTSEYIPKAMDFYTVSISKDKNCYLIDGIRDLKSVRFDKKVYVDFLSSSNVAGEKFVDGRTYVHFATNDSAILCLSDKKETQKEPYLVSANGKIVRYKRNKGYLHLELESYLPLKFELFVPKKCSYKLSKGRYKLSRDKDIVSIAYKKRKKVSIDEKCKL